MEAKACGASLIVIDPVLSETSSKADLWLKLRPGTDAALALGLLNVIVNEELFDKVFVGRWCLGFDALKERLREYPPETAGRGDYLGSRRANSRGRQALRPDAAREHNPGRGYRPECRYDFHVSGDSDACLNYRKYRRAGR